MNKTQNRGVLETAPGVLALCGVICIWSGWALLSRWGLLHSELGASELILLRLGFSGLLMLPVLLRIGLGGICLKDCLLLALAAGPCYVLLTYNGLRFAPASHGSALTAGVLPLFTTVFACWLGQLRHPSKMRWLGLGLVLSATTCFFYDGLTEAGELVWLGDLLIIGGPIVWAVYTVHVTKLNVTSVRATAIVSTFGLACFLPIYCLWGEPQRLVQASIFDVLSQGIWHGAVVVIGSLTLYTYTVRKLGPSNTTMGTAAVPAVTAVSAHFFLSERLTELVAIGVVLNASGLIVFAKAIVREQNYSKHAPPS